MTIANREKVTILQSTEVWDCNPVILILLIWVRWRHTCLGSKCKFCHRICHHLLRVRIRKGILNLLNSFLNRISCMCRATDRTRIKHMDTLILTSQNVRVWLGQSLLNVKSSGAITFLLFLGIYNSCLNGLNVDLLLVSFALNQILNLRW
jgi:hypothetical protein